MRVGREGIDAQRAGRGCHHLDPEQPCGPRTAAWRGELSSGEQLTDGRQMGPTHHCFTHCPSSHLADTSITHDSMQAFKTLQPCEPVATREAARRCAPAAAHLSTGVSPGDRALRSRFAAAGAPGGPLTPPRAAAPRMASAICTTAARSIAANGPHHQRTSSCAPMTRPGPLAAGAVAAAQVYATLM